MATTARVRDFLDMTVNIDTEYGGYLRQVTLIAVATPLADDPIGSHTAAVVTTLNGDDVLVATASITRIERSDHEPVPAQELDADTVERMGLDPTGRGGDPRWPYTTANITSEERKRAGLQ